jgi:Protein of unknown function (DUF2845)
MNVDARRLGWNAFVGACAVGLILFAAGASASGNGIRCENKIVGPGDSQYDVKSLCGPPDDVQQRTETRRVQRAVQRPCPNGIGYCSFVVDDIIDIVVEEWTYDFGTNKFLQYLTFEGGKLVHVRSGPYGHKQL